MTKAATKPNTSLTIRCCGVNYSPRSSDHYWRFTAYKNDYTHESEKEYVGNSKVFTTITYELACKEGCTKVKILKYSKGGVFLGSEDINKKEAAIKHLNKIYKTSKEIPIKCPVQNEPYAKRVDLFFGNPEKKEKNIKPVTIPTTLDGLLKRPAILCKITKYIDPHIKQQADNRQTA